MHNFLFWPHVCKLLSVKCAEDIWIIYLHLIVSEHYQLFNKVGYI